MWHRTDAAPDRGIQMLAEVVTDEPGRRVVLAGDVDCRSTERVRAALTTLLRTDPLGDDGLVVVDLSEVTSIDVTALRVIAAASCRAGTQGHRLVLRGAPGGVRRLLHLSHLIRVVELEPVPA